MKDQKEIARKEAFARRAEAFASVQADITDVVIELALNHDRVAAYMPMRTEFDILPAMTALHNASKQVCVPVITAKATPLTFHKWTPECEMIKGEFGAFIPKSSAPITPTLILAPLVGYDAQGTRIGYGGGFYDRTVASLRNTGECLLIGIAFSAQMSQSPLPSEPTDIPLDGIITENGLTYF